MARFRLKIGRHDTGKTVVHPVTGAPSQQLLKAGDVFESDKNEVLIHGQDRFERVSDDTPLANEGTIGDHPMASPANAGEVGGPKIEVKEVHNTTVATSKFTKASEAEVDVFGSKGTSYMAVDPEGKILNDTPLEFKEMKTFISDRIQKKKDDEEAAAEAVEDEEEKPKKKKKKKKKKRDE